MRKLLLATAAFALVGGAAAAAPDATVTINSSLAASCTVSGATTNLTLVGTTPETGLFTTTCNFSAANLHVNFVSDKGGVFNSVETVTALYTLSYDGHNYGSNSLLGAGQTADHAAGTAPQNYTVALDSALTVAGDYQDALYITVTP